MWERIDIRGLVFFKSFSHEMGKSHDVYRSIEVVPITYLIPTPPAINTNLVTVAVSGCDGGQKKLPPILTPSLVPRMSATGLHSHAAGGFRGELWMANSKKPFWTRPLMEEARVS